MQRFLTLGIAIVMVLVGASQAVPLDTSHRLGSGDRVKISVLNEPDLSKETEIDRDGYAPLDLVDRVKLQGMTCTEAAETVRKALAEYIVNPEVTVELQEIAKKKVFVTGEVRKPGILLLDSRAKLIEAVTLAEYTELADLSKISIRRKDKMLQSDLSLYLSGKDTTPNVSLEPEDSIIIPRVETVGTALVIGSVNKPGLVQLKNGMTFREVISVSGGVMVDADTLNISIKHEGSNESSTIAYDRAMAGDPTADIAIQAGDTLYVPKQDKAYFTIQGGVRQPGQYALKGQVTLEEATALAGGLTKDAVISEIQVIRVSGNAVNADKVDLKAIRQGKSPAVTLGPGDNVVVPTKKDRRSPLDVLTAIAGFGWLFRR